MSGNTGFTFKGNLAGRTSGIHESFIIANQATITVGDMVSLSSGFIALSGAGAVIMGVVVGITDKNGIDLTNSRYSLAQATWTASTQTVVCGAANTTGDQIRANIDIDPLSIWSATPDATMGTDDESDLAGCYTDIVAASDQPDENTAATTQGQLFIWGIDPENSTNGLYSIAQHQLWGWTIV